MSHYGVMLYCVIPLVRCISHYVCPKTSIMSYYVCTKASFMLFYVSLKVSVISYYVCPKASVMTLCVFLELVLCHINPTVTFPFDTLSRTYCTNIALC